MRILLTESLKQEIQYVKVGDITLSGRPLAVLPYFVT